MSIVESIESESAGWITRILRLLRAKTPARDAGEDSRATPADEPPPHPRLVRNPNPKPWNTLYKEHKPAGESLMTKRPTIVAIKGDQVIFDQSDE